MNRNLSTPSPLRALQLFQLMRFGTVFITGIVLAKSGMVLEEIGLFEALLFLSTATGFFWVNGLGNALTSSFNPTKEKESKALISASFILILTGSLFVSTLLWISKDALYSVTETAAAPFFGTFCLFTFFNNTSFFNETLFLLRKRGAALILYGLITLAFHIGGAVWIITSGGGIEHLLQWLLLLAVLKNLVLIYQLSASGATIPGTRTIIQQAKLASPLILSMLISGSAETIDGFLVSHFLGNEAFALFRYGARELPLSGILAAAMSQAMVARFAAEGITFQGLSTLKKESISIMHLVFPVSILLILFSSSIYPIFFSQDFQRSASVFNIYALLVISRMVFPQTLILALKRHDSIFRISIIELGINVICSIVLMRWFGMEGVAFGTVIAFLAEKILLYREVRKHTDIQTGDLIPLKTWLFYSLLLLTAYTFSVFT